MKTLRVQFILKRDAVKFLKLKTELPVLVYTAERERERDGCVFRLLQSESQLESVLRGAGGQQNSYH